MAMATTEFPRTSGASARSLQAGRWGGFLPHLLVAAGAVTVIVGSYTTWATFYAGLIARNGVAGHGKYFIAAAVAALLASLVTRIPGVWGGMRWLSLPLGSAIGFYAFRDLRNLDALILDPGAAFYVPGRGDGLFVVIVGAVILALAPVATRSYSSGPTRLLPTVLAAGAVAGVGLLIAGLYGEYYLHFASGGHAAGHTEALQPAHLLTAVGAVVLLATSHLALIAGLKSRA